MQWENMKSNTDVSPHHPTTHPHRTPATVQPCTRPHHSKFQTTIVPDTPHLTSALVMWDVERALRVSRQLRHMSVLVAHSWTVARCHILNATSTYPEDGAFEFQLHDIFQSEDVAPHHVESCCPSWSFGQPTVRWLIEVVWHHAGETLLCSGNLSL